LKEPDTVRGCFAQEIGQRAVRPDRGVEHEV
jgi:hypothetical protein